MEFRENRTRLDFSVIKEAREEATVSVRDFSCNLENNQGRLARVGLDKRKEVNCRLLFLFGFSGSKESQLDKVWRGLSTGKGEVFALRL